METDANTRFTALLKSDEYVNELKKLSAEIREKCIKAENEATVSSYFEDSLYFFIRSFFGKDISFIKEKSPSNTIRHIFNKKRMDAISSNLIIEYKHASKLKRTEEINKNSY